jgi:segregation and condensation protein B
MQNLDVAAVDLGLGEGHAIAYASPDPEDRPDPEPGADERAEVRLDEVVGIVEAMLFAAAEPIPVARLVQVLDGIERREVLAALAALRDRLDADASGVQLVEVGGGWQLRTRAEHAPWIRRLLGGRPPRLSRAMLETVAIVAYRQPCTRPEIEAIRGVDVGAVMATLVERRLVRILGRKDAPGRPILYGTTPEFLEVFGLPDLAALPPLKDVGDFPTILADAELAVTGGGVVPVAANAGSDAGAGGEDDDDDTRGDGVAR